MRGIFTTACFLFTTGLAIAQTDTMKNVITQEVTITGNRAGANDPTTFQNISGQDIQKNNLGQDLPYMLDLTPSLITTSDAGGGVGYTGMRIRGTDATRINVTINGVPMNEPDDHSVYWVDMPDIATSTESIQIQRGVGTSTNGSGAFGGSVNMKTDAVSLKPFGEVTASYGSFNTRKFSFKGGSGLIKNIFFIEARGSYVASDGYVDRASSNLWSYFIQAGIVKNKTMLRFVHFNGHEKTYQAWNGVSQDSLTTNRRYNISGTDYGASAIPWYNQVDIYQKQYFQLILTQGLGHNWNLNAVAFLTLGKGYYEEYKVNDALANYGVVDSTITNANLLRHKWLKNYYSGTIFSFNYDNKRNLEASIGGMYANFTGSNFGNLTWVQGFTQFDPNRDYYLNKFHKNEANIYARANYSPVKVLNLYADLQYRFVEMGAHGLDDAQTVVDFSHTYHFFNPKGGISVKTGKIGRVYASYALAHREPSRTDIIENLNSIAPKPEKLHDIEAGIDITNDMVKTSKMWLNFPVHLNGYYMYYVDQLVLTGALNDVGDPLRVNVPQSFRAGAELMAEINFHRPETMTKLFGIRYSVSYNLSKIKNFTEVVPGYDSTYTNVSSLNKTTTYPNTDIAFSPRWVGFIELNTMAVKNLEIAWAFKFIGKQYLDNTQSDERSLHRYWYSNVRVSYLLKVKNRAEVRFTMLFNNIFNKLYESNGYTYRERYQNSDGSVSDPVSYNFYYPQAGFNVMGGVSVRF